MQFYEDFSGISEPEINFKSKERYLLIKARCLSLSCSHNSCVLVFTAQFFFIVITKSHPAITAGWLVKKCFLLFYYFNLPVNNFIIDHNTYHVFTC